VTTPCVTPTDTPNQAISGDYSRITEVYYPYPPSPRALEIILVAVFFLLCA
jgi:hypothetical protein